MSMPQFVDPSGEPQGSGSSFLLLKHLTDGLPHSLQTLLGEALLNSITKPDKTQSGYYKDTQSLGIDCVKEMYRSWYEQLSPMDKAFLMLESLSEQHLSKIRPKLNTLVDAICDYHQQQQQSQTLPIAPLKPPSTQTTLETTDGNEMVIKKLF